MLVPQKKSYAIKESIIRKHLEIRAILDKDLRTTLSHLEAEAHAAVSALDWLMEKNWSLIRDIEQDLAGIAVTLDHEDLHAHEMVNEHGIYLGTSRNAELQAVQCTSVEHICLTVLGFCV